MKSLRIAWGAMYFAGMVMIIVDLAFRSTYDVGGIPIASSLGAALVLVSVTSMLNWMFKEAWEEHSRAKPAGQNDDAAG